MSVDARLANPLLLMLAAKRCQAARQVPDWRRSEGLYALLQAAKGVPQRDPWDLPSVEDGDGLAGLLAEARRREHRHGA